MMLTPISSIIYSGHMNTSISKILHESKPNTLKDLLKTFKKKHYIESFDDTSVDAANDKYKIPLYIHVIYILIIIIAIIVSCIVMYFLRKPVA